MLDTKDISNKWFGYIYTCDETLSCIEFSIRESYHLALKSTPVQSVFGMDMIFNLVSIFGCWATTNRNQQQVGIDNAWKIPHNIYITIQ